MSLWLLKYCNAHWANARPNLQQWQRQNHKCTQTQMHTQQTAAELEEQLQIPSIKVRDPSPAHSQPGGETYQYVNEMTHVSLCVREQPINKSNRDDDKSSTI